MAGKHDKDTERRIKYKYYDEEEVPRALRKEREEYEEDEEIPKAFRKEIGENEIPKALRKDEHIEELGVNKTKMSKKKTKHKKLKIFGKVILVFVIILAMLLGAAYWYVNNKMGKMQKVEINDADLGISKEANSNLSKYRNIAIFGVDSRADDYGVGNRSDCIIIASINNSTGEIKLISVYRDTYVNIKGHGLDKITHAYSYGEAPLAINTLNKNLDLNIKEFVTVNFDSVSEAVDQLGGIKISIDSEEIKYINGYIDETSRVTGKKSSHITQAGTYNLDGVQAVAYSRIRYTAGGDYKRTERMRTVIEAMFTKLKTKSIGEINAFADKILPCVYTNLSTGDLISLVPNMAKYKISESVGWPYDTKGITLDRWYGVPVTLESNVIQLHKEAFGESEYTPSEDIKSISNSIINKTGYRK